MSRSRFETRLLLLAFGFTVIAGPWVSAHREAAGQDSSETSTGGMRTLQGRHLTLVTDLPSTPAVDGLPSVFDQAISQWANYFNVDPDAFSEWRIRGYLMRNDQRFRDRGLLPDDLPPFLHGYQRGDSLWLREQPSEYYQRHLLLHEGTHAFMLLALGGTGAAWYREGVAEFLATHRYENGALQLHAFPRSRKDVPHWGRIKIIRDAVAAGKMLTLADVLRADGADFHRVDAYAWSWAAIVFLDSHARFSTRFGELQRHARLPHGQFSAWLWRQLQSDQRELQDAWEVFLSQLDYGYDASADTISYQAVKPFQQTSRVTVKTDCGWQSTGFRLAAGRVYRIRAHGRYQIALGDETWWSEAGGVTLRYHDGIPLGRLIAALDDPQSQRLSFARPISVGVSGVVQPERDAVLFLRINEPAGQLADNHGSLLVQIEEVVDSPN